VIGEGQQPSHMYPPQSIIQSIAAYFNTVIIIIFLNYILNCLEDPEYTQIEKLRHCLTFIIIDVLTGNRFSFQVSIL